MDEDEYEEVLMEEVEVTQEEVSADKEIEELK